MPVQQQQWQHLRLPGPPALLRAPDAARRALRARRLGDRARRLASRASGSTRPTTSSRIPTAAIWFTDPPYGGQLYEGAPDARGRPEQRRRAGSTRGSASRRASAPAKRELPTNCYRIDPSGRARPRRHRGAGARPERPVLLAGLQEALRREHRQGPGRHRAGRQGRHLRVRRRRRQQAVEPASCSPTAWSTA